MEGATTCSSCYNDGLNTSIGARQLASNACSTKVANVISNCKYYNSGITATKTVGDCLECNAMTWLNITGNASAASITMACSATSIDTTTNCTTAVASCAQSACYVALVLPPRLLSAENVTLVSREMVLLSQVSVIQAVPQPVSLPTVLSLTQSLTPNVSKLPLAIVLASTQLVSQLSPLMLTVDNWVLVTLIWTMQE